MSRVHKLLVVSSCRPSFRSQKFSF